MPISYLSICLPLSSSICLLFSYFPFLSILPLHKLRIKSKRECLKVDGEGPTFELHGNLLQSLVTTCMLYVAKKIII
jgi:hypothetical protein